MYKCFNCGNEEVSWKQDFSPKDFSMEWQGVIQTYICPKCKAYILFEIPSEEHEKKEEDQLEGQTNIFDLIGEE